MISILGKIGAILWKAAKVVLPFLIKGSKAVGKAAFKIGGVSKVIGTKLGAVAAKAGASANTVKAITMGVPILTGLAGQTITNVIQEKFNKAVKNETGRKIFKYGVIEPAQSLIWASII